MDFDYIEYFNQLNKEKQVSKNKMADYMIECARKRNRPIEGSMNDWLEWNLNLFDSRYFKEEILFEHYEECQQKDPDYFNLTTAWFNEMHFNWHQKEEPFDMFGSLYEAAFQSGKKASSTGQFFTPMSLSRMMAKMTLKDSEEKSDFVTANDCACGSGRLLLAAIEQFSPQQKQFYIGQDLDFSSVMMTALNLMAHNRHALVICQNTLMLDEPSRILLVNEVDFPYSTGYMSITSLTTEEAIERGWLEKDNNEGKGYVAVPGNYERLCKNFVNLSPEDIKNLLPNHTLCY